jgi:hypothetical protein
MRSGTYPKPGTEYIVVREHRDLFAPTVIQTVTTIWVPTRDLLTSEQRRKIARDHNGDDLMPTGYFTV